MASPGELVEEAARVLGLPVATVVVHDRNLVIAGARSKGGRGANAAKVTPRDAAHLLVAVLASAQVKESVSSLARYRRTRCHLPASSPAGFTEIGLAELEGLAPDHSFVDALEALLRSGAMGSLSRQWTPADRSNRARAVVLMPAIDIQVLTPQTLAEIRIAGTGKGISRSLRYLLPQPLKRQGDARPSASAWDDWEAMLRQHRRDGDLVQYRRISEVTIMALSRLLAAKPED